jgi:sulfite reductase (NADPH) flavoprotein alpha-component
MSSYSRTSPFITRLLSRARLNKTGSTKETWHVVLSIEGSGITYRPGDSMGICPENDGPMCDAILSSCGFAPDEQVQDPRTHESFAIRDFLRKKANLSVPTRKLMLELVQRGATHLDKLLQPEQDELFREFLHAHNVLELLQEHPEANLGPQDLVQNLAPLLPRLYSIASSQGMYPDEVHFTVSRVRYEVHGKKRLGVASHFLCDMVKENALAVPIYLQQTKDFLLPEDNQQPVIMIGPGTGIAPFRAFMQERFARENPTSKNWLFFGECHKACDFFYEDYWQDLAAKKMLRVSEAFSRDQEQKVYVQHRLWEMRKEVWDWIQNGAHIYVCGDAQRMAKDVDLCLQNIIKEALQIPDESARHFLADLRKQKRYLRDVY